MRKIEVKKYQHLEHIISMGALKIGTILFVLLVMVLIIIMEAR